MMEQLSKMTKEQRMHVYQANNLPQSQIDQIEASFTPQHPQAQPANPQDSCIFCSIVNGSTPSKKVAENADFVAVLDIQPKTPGHTVLISKRHTDKYDTLSDTELASLNMIKHTVLDKLTNSLGATGSTIMSVNGVSSGQKVPHYAEHIIPTYGEFPELPGFDMIHAQKSSNLVQGIIDSKVENALLDTKTKVKKEERDFSF